MKKAVINLSETKGDCMRKFLFSMIALFAVPALSETKEFDAAGLKEVEVVNTAGKVSIAAAEGGKATVVATKNKFPENCTLKIDKNGDDLTVKVEKTKSGWFSKDDCDVDLDIKVPKAVDVALKVGSGGVTISGLEGELDFAVGSGTVKADGLFTEVDGKTGSGKVEINGLAGGGDLKTGSGKVDITFAKTALKGELSLKTGSGNATLSFPKGSQVATDFKAGSGKLTNQLGDTPNAAFQVSMKAGSGNLDVKTY